MVAEAMAGTDCISRLGEKNSDGSFRGEAFEVTEAATEILLGNQGTSFVLG